MSQSLRDDYSRHFTRFNWYTCKNDCGKEDKRGRQWRRDKVTLFLPTNEPGDKLLWNRSLTLVCMQHDVRKVYMLESRIHLISFLEILPRYRDTFRNVCFDLYFDILRCTTKNVIQRRDVKEKDNELHTGGSMLSNNSVIEIYYIQ